MGADKSLVQDIPLLVIGASVGRTGTMSLKAALEILYEMPCYHMTKVLQSTKITLNCGHTYSTLWNGIEYCSANSVQQTNGGGGTAYEQLSNRKFPPEGQEKQRTGSLPGTFNEKQFSQAQLGLVNCSYMPFALKLPPKYK
ncbi:hypothetical protein FGIG_11684 [Fasciola gigantica]|uniref:Uncharacterized protein n=1 Tax=Fasciola gigantica TaxID=46835 RepID=A0A504YLH8_FASGI|nr:hypothetical protein FGIG_11684 [Fasciola gigantica]